MLLTLMARDSISTLTSILKATIPQIRPTPRTKKPNSRIAHPLLMAALLTSLSGIRVGLDEGDTGQ
jgi:hypothetical protein